MAAVVILNLPRRQFNGFPGVYVCVCVYVCVSASVFSNWIEIAENDIKN